MIVATATGSPRSTAAAISPSSGNVALLTRLNEDVQDAAAGQAHSKRVILADAVPLENRPARLRYFGLKLVDGALDAAARDRADHLAAGFDGQRGTGSRGALRNVSTTVARPKVSSSATT